MAPESLSRVAFLISGGCALLCVPAILIAEQRGWSQVPFNVAQFLATIVCFVSSVTFLVRYWGSESASGFERSLAVVAAILSGFWLAVCFYVILILDMSGMD
jgi:hypothetical protein